MLLKIPDVIRAEDVRRIRAALEQADWQDGRATAGHQAAATKRNQQLPADSPLGERLAAGITEALAHCGAFMGAALPLKLFPPRFNRYRDGGEYGAHIDNAVLSVPGSAHRVRGDLSATLFLSEPDDYDGGELEILGDGEPQTVKLPAGHLVVYPGSQLHRVTPVTRGTRYAAFFWIQSLVPDPQQRALLWQLDRSIQALGARHGDDPELPRLTGLYHNLLRLWSQT